jgi:hypothetical protein
MDERTRLMLRELMSDALLKDDLAYFKDNISELEGFLYMGFRGYIEYTDEDLVKELRVRELPIPTIPRKRDV